MPAKPGDPRNHQSKRERFRREVLTLHGPVCQMPRCFFSTRAINLTLKSPHPASYEADHVETCAQLQARGAPLSDYYDPRNGRPSHARCNRSKGASDGNRNRGRRTAKPNRLNTSRTW